MGVVIAAIQIGIWVAGSLVFLAYSWSYLSDARSHGFYRFFAWECLLGLIVLNLTAWFNNFLALNQIISWILLTGSIFLAVHGFWLLQEVGKPEGKFEDTTNLVETGAYRLIRHPLYASLILLGLGIFAKKIELISILLVVGVCFFLYLTSRIEERENVDRFGEVYRDYMTRTKMFIPWIF